MTEGTTKGSPFLHHLLSLKVSAEDLAGLPFWVWVMSVHMRILLCALIV